MAACPRSHIVAKGEVGVYHCWNRCVRRAFLCGYDRFTRKNYNYRRGWIRKLQQQLARLFAIEIAFHAEMQNHIHLIIVASVSGMAKKAAETGRRWFRGISAAAETFH